MMDDKDPSIKLTLTDIRVIFPRLKTLEDQLSEPERDILSKMENLLYKHLSIDELEQLMRKDLS
ncbi:hypothetical protein [Gracilinema caldarium]|uniref:Uncharacterized protein n=1 Tax=Gracilinema caldarium (strain ATCC 51460 / DSM 7334 / H1) TaxID=744872 RepID=F8F3G6_GRAC1|nr:hypothetical protein [Gracilinema caldarium]AEJ19542.1 hypothetical protein Spica_1396 [Gracilinema caldarium DSM 7334]